MTDTWYFSDLIILSTGVLYRQMLVLHHIDLNTRWHMRLNNQHYLAVKNSKCDDSPGRFSLWYIYSLRFPSTTFHLYAEGNQHFKHWNCLLDSSACFEALSLISPLRNKQHNLWIYKVPVLWRQNFLVENTLWLHRSYVGVSHVISQMSAPLLWCALIDSCKY